jgi:hypothetical protein
MESTMGKKVKSVKNTERPEKRATEEDNTMPSQWLAELDALKDFSDGWDSYSAPAPSQTAIDNAKSLVNVAIKLGVTPEHVEPSAMGGTGVTFSTGSRDVVIEFYNNGTAHALFSDEVTGAMNTLAVTTSQDGYRRVIGEVRKYLYGEESKA